MKYFILIIREKNLSLTFELLVKYFVELSLWIRFHYKFVKY